MNDGTLGKGPDADHSVQGRSVAYWLSSLITTGGFFYFVALLLMVPGVSPTTKLWILIPVCLAAIVSLCAGLWRYSSSEAPIWNGPLAVAMAVVLMLEIAYCVVSVCLILKIFLR
jgi:uncharacterized membrane protein YidH (DUF202 family)